MKKIIALILALAMVMALAGCGSDGNPGADAGQTKAADAGQTQADEGQSAAVLPGGDDTPAPPADSGNSGSIESCADLSNFYEKLVDAMYKVVTDLQDAHNETVDYTQMVNIWYMPFSSLRFIDAAMFTKDATASTVETTLKMLGNEDAQVTQDGSSVVITYTGKDYSTEQTYAYKEVITWDFSAMVLSVVDYHDGEMSSFTEFVGLGGDRYAISSEYERAIVTYAGGEITGMLHAENIHDTDYDTNEYTADSYIFTYDEGKILGRTDLDENWVKAAESTGKLYHLFDLKDGSCHITGLKQEYDWNSGESKYVEGYDVTLP